MGACASSDTKPAVCAGSVSLSQAGAGSGAGAGGGASSTSGPGVRIAPTITAVKPTSRATSDRVPSGRGSEKTIGPAAIVTTLAAALVIAMTATAGPSWSERSADDEADEREDRDRRGFRV